MATDPQSYTLPSPLPSPLQTTAPLHETFESLQLGPRPPSLPHDVLLHILAILAILDPERRFRNLKRLARVSKEWKEAVYDELYANVVLVGRVQIERFLSSSPRGRTLNLVLHSGRKQSSQELARTESVSAALRRCKGLKSLGVEGFAGLVPSYFHVEEAACLERLTLCNAYAYYCDSHGPDVPIGLKYLRYLSINAGTTMRRTPLALYLNATKTLEHLRYENDVDGLSDDVITCDVKLNDLVYLTTLSIVSKLPQHPSPTLLLHCPNLIHITFSGPFTASTVTSSIQLLPSSVRLESLSANALLVASPINTLKQMLSLPQSSSISTIELEGVGEYLSQYAYDAREREVWLEGWKGLWTYCDGRGITIVGGLDSRDDEGVGYLPKEERGA